MTAEHLIGKQAGNYRLVERLGAGGMGEVYKAVHATIGSKVAIKVLHATAARDKGLQERFVLEAQAVNRIEHSGVVKVIDAGRMDGGRPYLVMELLDGRSLHELRKQNQLTWQEACKSVIDVLDALAAAHAAGVVHRDLKPANLFRTRDGRTVVLDFGIAKLLTNDAAALKLTVTGTAIGTPHYMAPEQIRGEQATPAADLYAMGVTLFELVCGRRPFEDTDEQSVMLSHLNKRPPPPRALAPEIPVALQDLILMALAKNPAKRPSSAAVMRDALRGAITNAPDVATPPPRLAEPPVPRKAPAPPVAQDPNQRSVWARPDIDDAVTLQRQRRPSQDAPTKAASPRLHVMPPVAPNVPGKIGTTERDPKTPDGVRAHRERSRLHVLLGIGAATIAVVGGLVLAFGMRGSREAAKPPKAAAVEPSDASVPVDAAPPEVVALRPDAGFLSQIFVDAGVTATPPTKPSIPPIRQLDCISLATMKLTDAGYNTVIVYRQKLVEECARYGWPQSAIRCLIAANTQEAMINCINTTLTVEQRSGVDFVRDSDAPKPVDVQITSTPAGAEVSLNGEPIGKTPWKGKLQPRTFDVEIRKKGCDTAKRQLKPKTGTTVLDVALLCHQGSHDDDSPM